MQYEIKGEPLPVVICYPQAGEVLITESGSMSWMSPNMKMETTSNGGIGKVFGRMFSGESLFLNRYTAMGGNGLIAFASSFPGTILPFEISPGHEIIAQKSAFLASDATVDLSIHFQKKICAGLFGGEGFIMQKLSGYGTAFIEVDGYCQKYDLKTEQSIVVDTGYLVAMTPSCSMEIKSVPGVKNVLFGGEGLFNTVITGPGTVYLQTMPISAVAGSLRSYFPSSGN